VVWRTTWRAALRRELWNGNRESFRSMLFSRYSMPLWVLKQHGNTRRRIPEIAAQHPHLQVIRIATRREADAWLQSIQPIESMSGSSKGSDRQKTPPFAET
jgi:hypothetical protein